MAKVKKGSRGKGPSGDQPPIPPTEEKSPSKQASRAVTRRATAKSPQSLDPLWQLLDEKIGGREGFLAAALASNNPKAKQLVEHLLDKNHRHTGTKRLAEKAGLSAPEIVDMFRDRQWLEATLVLHEELPAIIRDTAQDARAQLVPCPDCNGIGSTAEATKCLPCRGTGEIRKAGDKDKLAFVGEAVGMIRKREPLVQVNTQINNQGRAESQSFDDLMRRATIVQARPQLTEAKEAEIVENGSGNVSGTD